MGFEIASRFEFCADDETKPVKDELRKLKKSIAIEFSSDSMSITVFQKDTFTGKKVDVALFRVDWDLHYSHQSHSYTATCYIDNEEYRKIDLHPDVGQYIYELFLGLSSGDIVGSPANTIVRYLFREFEIKDAPADSWVKKHFPKLFKQEEGDVEKQRKKIVKDVMRQ